MARGWKERTREDFRFAVKVSRLITHVHRLKDCGEAVSWFFREMEPLNEKVLAYLLQFPPSFSPSPESLELFLKQLPEDNRYVFEFRNKNSYSGSIPGLMEKKGLGFCIHDFSTSETPLLVTADPVYLRFHGFRSRYAGSYPDDVLAAWAERIMKWADEGRRVLVYFNNDMEGSAV